MSTEQIKPGYKRTEVGVIPEDWTIAPLSDFLSFISYGFTNPMPTVRDGIYMVTAADIAEGRIQLDTARKTSVQAYKSLLTAKSKPRQNDILLTKDGTLGRLALVGGETICVNQSVAVLRSNEKIQPNFLKHLLESPYYQKRMVDEAGGSTIKHIYITIVDKMPIGLPVGKIEQQAIATALSDVDALLAKLDQLIAKKRDLKQATIQQLLTGQTRLPGFSGEWEVKRLGDVLRFQVGFPFSSDFFNQVGGGLRLVKNRDLKADDQIFFFSGKFDESFIVKDGDVLIGMDGDFLPCLWSKGHALLNQRVGRIVPSSRVNALFSYYMLTEPLKSIEYSTAATTVKHLSHSDVEGIELAMPEVDEQTAIATVLSDMDAELANLEARRDKTRALKQGMMQELLTGRVRLI